ncbi:MAG TPA: TonB-dependent receptor, partial [Gemmatimonadales bacterium]|nr:TonB-dependent receptor [Gemmatimonadales bacterium]
QLDDLQSTATRVAMPGASVAAAVTILDGDELRRRGIGFLIDALAEVPGLATVQTGSYGAASSLFVRGGESDYTKLLIDGVPVNQPGGFLNLANIRLDDVDRIEIVRGPVSVLHGADAVSGVIQVFTRSGREGSAAELTATAGSFANRDVGGRFGAASGGWNVSLSGSHLESDGIYEFNSRYRNDGGSLRLGWDGDHGARFAMTARYTDSDAHFPTNSSGDVVDRNQHVLDRTLLLGLGAARPIGSLTLVADGWLLDLESDARDPQDGVADTTGFAFSATRDARIKRLGGQVGMDWMTRPGLTLSVRAGLERESEDQQSATVSDFGFGRDESVGDFSAERINRQAHLQAVAALADGIAIQAGIRHDDSDAFGGFTTWRAGASWALSSQWRMWGAAGTAFKAPLFSELFASTAFEIGNPALLPERTRALEAGLGWRRGSMELNVAAYAQRFSDLIQYIAAAPGEPTYVNLGAAEAQGVEVSAALRLPAGLVVRAEFGLLRTEVTDSGTASSAVFRQGESLIRRPGRTIGVTLQASPLGGNLAIGWRWAGERVDADLRDFPASRITLPSYGVVSAALGVPVVSRAPGRPGFELLLRGENILDAEWEQALGFSGRGRTLLLGGRATY